MRVHESLSRALQASLLSSCAILAWCSPSNGAADLSVDVSFGGYVNNFIRDESVSAVVLISANSSNAQRFLVASPAGNSGAVAYFNASNNSTGFQVALVPGTVQSVRDGSNSGVTGTLTFSQDAELVRAIVGSVRAMRDYVEGGGLTHPIFNHTTLQQGSSVLLYRQYINGTNSVNLTFTPANSQTTITALPDGNLTVATTGGSARINFTWISSEAQLEGYSPAALFTSDSNLANTPEAQQVVLVFS